MNYQVNIDFKDQQYILRDLKDSDEEILYSFLSGLHRDTIRKSFLNCNLREKAGEFCSSIGKYDKYRYILENDNDEIIALFEFSLDLPTGDVARYDKYSDTPAIDRICRWGLTIADEYQNMGIGSFIFPEMKKIAEQLKKEFIILYGGVYRTNSRAIHFYKKLGFKELGTFCDQNGIEAIDMILALEEEYYGK